MKRFLCVLLQAMCLSGLVEAAEDNFVVTGTAIPNSLLRQNYGPIPKEVIAYDLNVCNISDSKLSIVSSRIFQALTESNPGLRPIGRQIMLAAILRNQNRSKGMLVTMLLNSMTGVLSVLSSSKLSPPPGLLTAAALGALSAQQVVTSLRPVLTTDQLQKFESEVLEPALVLDKESCAERTVFASASAGLAKAAQLNFRFK